MQIQEYVTLAPYTTLKVGGPARYVVTVQDIADLESARTFILEQNLPYLILGSGSNVLVTDHGFQGVVIKNEMRGISFQENQNNKVISEVGAGELLDVVVAKTTELGYWGLENLSHIPGTIGATPVQNVGAYGVEVSSLIMSVSAFNMTTGEHKQFSNADCDFSYRESFFKTPVGREWVIVNVMFELQLDPHPVLDYKDLSHLNRKSDVTQSEIRQTVIEVRSQKFPDWERIGTAGSFFKNPIVPTDQAAALQVQYPELPIYSVDSDRSKVSLGYILDKVCGLKGFSIGPVSLYENQALVLVQTGDSAAAVQLFIDHVTQVVAEKTGIIIEQEVRTV